jgi:hypothetical protein
MDALWNAVLAALVFAVLYATSRAAKLWSTFLTRRSKASSKPDAQAQGRIRTAKFGARFH